MSYVFLFTCPSLFLSPPCSPTPASVRPLNCIFGISVPVTHSRQTRTDGRTEGRTVEWRKPISVARRRTIMIPAAAAVASVPTLQAKAARSDSSVVGAWRARERGDPPTAYERKSEREGERNGRSTRGTTIRSFQPSQSVFSNRPSNPPPAAAGMAPTVKYVSAFVTEHRTGAPPLSSPPPGSFITSPSPPLIRLTLLPNLSVRGGVPAMHEGG